MIKIATDFMNLDQQIVDKSHEKNYQSNDHSVGNRERRVRERCRQQREPRVRVVSAKERAHRDKVVGNRARRTESGLAAGKPGSWLDREKRAG